METLTATWTTTWTPTWITTSTAMQTTTPTLITSTRARTAVGRVAALAPLGFGKIPFSVIWQTYALVFAATGFGAQSALPGDRANGAAPHARVDAPRFARRRIRRRGARGAPPRPGPLVEGRRRRRAGPSLSGRSASSSRRRSTTSSARCASATRRVTTCASSASSPKGTTKPVPRSTRASSSSTTSRAWRAPGRGAGRRDFTRGREVASERASERASEDRAGSRKKEASMTGLENTSNLIVVGGGVGVGVLVLVSFMTMVSRCYRRCGADEALVRTGSGGNKVVIGGGVLVFPVIHQLLRVSLRSVKLLVERSGKNALVTGDKIKANVTTELYIKVQPLADDVLAAARSFGERNLDEHAIGCAHRRQAHRRAPIRRGGADVHVPPRKAKGVRRAHPGCALRGAQEERAHARERVDHQLRDGPGEGARRARRVRRRGAPRHHRARAVEPREDQPDPAREGRRRSRRRTSTRGCASCTLEQQQQAGGGGPGAQGQRVRRASRARRRRRRSTSRSSREISRSTRSRRRSRPRASSRSRPSRSRWRPSSAPSARRMIAAQKGQQAPRSTRTRSSRRPRSTGRRRSRRRRSRRRRSSARRSS